MNQQMKKMLFVGSALVLIAVLVWYLWGDRAAYTPISMKASTGLVGPGEEFKLSALVEGGTFGGGMSVLTFDCPDSTHRPKFSVIGADSEFPVDVLPTPLVEAPPPGYPSATGSAEITVKYNGGIPPGTIVKFKVLGGGKTKTCTVTTK